MKAPALIIMAAGMGSRFGGLKQIEPITSRGESLIDFSVYDALRAGFGEIIIVIKKDIEQDFEEAAGRRLRRMTDFRYAYQEIVDLPDGYGHLAHSRGKPWGTAQAVLCARDLVTGSFAVINADDFYGHGAFEQMYGFLSSSTGDYAMLGYRLGNTLTDNGSVSRGICRVEDGYVRSITELKKIFKRADGAEYTLDGENYHNLDIDSIVSMQFFGFNKGFFNYLEREFPRFLENDGSEFLLAGVIDGLISSGEVKMRCIPCSEQWYGITYAQDKPPVTLAIEKLLAAGLYK